MEQGAFIRPTYNSLSEIVTQLFLVDYRDELGLHHLKNNTAFIKLQSIASTSEALLLVAKERQDQLEKHQRSTLYDFTHNKYGQLLEAVHSLLYDHKIYPKPPLKWDVNIWKKMTSKTKKEKLVIAAALLIAEIDRLNFEEKHGKDNQ